MTPPLTLQVSGRELIITGKFKVEKIQNGNPRWVLRLSMIGLTGYKIADPAVHCNLLSKDPIYDTVQGVIMFLFINEDSAKKVAEQLVDDQYADLVLFQGGPITTSKSIKPDPHAYDAIKAAIKNIPPIYPFLESLDQQRGAEAREQGAAKYGARNWQHTPHKQKTNLCDECGGSGFYQGLNTSEPCSQGCKP